MNRADARKLVSDAIGRTDKDTEINTALDLAVEEVSSRFTWSDLFLETSATLSVDSPSIELASDLARLTEVRILDTSSSVAWNLEIRSKTWVLSQVPYPPYESSSKPVHGYLEEGNKLFFYPVPDSAYTIRYSYYRLHPKLASDASLILIRHAGAAVAAYAIHWMLLTLERQQEADKWEAKYTKALASAIQVDMDNSAVKFKVGIRKNNPSVEPKFWLDPFVRRVP